ncbi:hypothetical protein N657DRAFT_631874 [Parathielavia appendiculata]|uniref:Uncharacterized protein n=1 Tax=Parathielavia appendiculata TaxID=2587402 RepID=A0AAN6U361_9PEZI|nr:hypothetical protein N657DRAFT_631874 [Parathielavia appendiculata]
MVAPVARAIRLLSVLRTRRSAVTLAFISLRWSRALGRGQYGYEHGLLNLTAHGLLGRGAVYICQDENPSDLPESCETPVPFVARSSRKAMGHGVSLAALAPAHAPDATSPAADSGTIDHEDFYDVVVDAADWPANTTKTSATQALPMGRVAVATYHSDGKLLGDINKTRPAESQLGPLYQSNVLVNKTGTLTGTVTFTSASTVVRMSDTAPKPESDDPLPVKNLTFSKLKSAVKIPLLYQSAKFAFSWDFNDISGAVYEFNPIMFGRGADRHTHRSNTHRPASWDSRRPNRGIRDEPAGARDASPDRGAAAHRRRHASIPGYAENAVHKQSQTILQNIMFYHMNESDRTSFLTYPKPRDLPLELADNLPADLKTWIHDTYAPAYMSFMLSQVSPADSSEGQDLALVVRLALADRCRAPQSQGKNCLSKTDQSRAAMIALFITAGPDNTLNALLEQPINSASHTPALKPSVPQNVNLLNMYCNILHTLAPKPSDLGEYADRLFQAVLSYAQSVQMTSTAVFSDPTGETAHQWLYDGMSALIQATLNNDPSLDSTVRNDLLIDLNDLQTELGIDANQANTVKTRLMLAEMNILIANMAKWMSQIGKGISILGGRYCAGLAGWVFDRAAGVTSRLSPKAIGLMKGTAIVALTAVYAFAAISSFLHWDTLSGTGRGEAILITAKMVTDVFGKSFEAWSEYKKPPRPGPGPEPAPAPEQGQQMNLELGQAEHGSPQPSLPGLVDGASGVAMGERKVQAEDLKEPTPFNEEVPAAPAAAESRSAGAWRRFNTPSDWLRAAGIVLSVALLVAISTGLAIVVDVAIFAGEMYAMTTAMYVAALPILDAVLAVIGLIVVVLMLTLDVTKKEDPPLTHVETFIRGTAKPLVAAWDAMPQPALSYSMPTKVTPGAPTVFSVSAQNGSGADVARTSVKGTVEGGSNASCLFSELAMADLGVLPGGAAAAALTLHSGQVAAEAVEAGPPEEALSEAITQTQRSSTVTSWNLVVRGVADPDTNPTGALKLLGTGGVKQGFVVSFCGVVNQAGSNVVQIVETLVTGDSCRALFRIAWQ